jgi:O-antigen/teichoic acid export membrane protein
LFRILLLGEMGLQTLFWAYSLLLAMNGHRLALRLTAVASLIGVACTIAAAKLAGPLGVAVVTSAVWIGLYAVIGVKAVRMAEGQCERGAAGEPAVLDASGPSA